MFSIDGIVSGFETSQIIESLLGFQQSQIDNLNSRKADVATQQTSVKGIEAQILTLQTSLSQLNRSRASVFDVRSANSSHEQILVADAESAANPGIYQLTVESLAAAHQIASQGLSSSSATLGQGEISLRVGNRAEQQITIDQNNNTLAGIAEAINEQTQDVNANIVFDQASNSFRLLLASKFTGSENAITIQTSLSGGASLDFSGPPVQQPADAVVRLGSGEGAITAQFSSNRVDGLIEGVSLDLLTADANTTVTIDVAIDTTSAQEAIQSFVDDFNSVIEFIDEQTRFNPQTGQASPLLGNRSISTIKTQLLSIVSNTLSGSGQLNRLRQIGVDLNTTGRLVIDRAKLEQALNEEIEGVGLSDVKRLFGVHGSSSNAAVKFLAAGPRTQQTTSPYQVDITRAAERAAISATNALPDNIVIDDSNNVFQIIVDGVSSNPLTLESGSYTPEESARQLENTINSSTTLKVHRVMVGIAPDNRLTITSEAYGSTSSIAGVSGAAAAVVGFDGTEQGSGQDVAGVFLVDGVEEIAKGSGRLLIGDPENANTADLQLLVTMATPQLSDGPDAEVTISQGVTSQLDHFVRQLLDSEFGVLKSLSKDFRSRMDSIDQSIKRVEDITAARREALIAEFTALESVLSDLQNTSSFVTSQLATLSTFRSTTRG